MNPTCRYINAKLKETRREDRGFLTPWIKEQSSTASDNERTNCEPWKVFQLKATPSSIFRNGMKRIRKRGVYRRA